MLKLAEILRTDIVESIYVASKNGVAAASRAAVTGRPANKNHTTE